MLCKSDSDDDFQSDSGAEYESFDDESVDEEKIKKDAAKKVEEVSEEANEVFNQQRKEVDDVFNHESFNKLLADNNEHFKELRKANNVDIVDEVISSVYRKPPDQNSPYIVEETVEETAESSTKTSEEEGVIEEIKEEEPPYSDLELPTIREKVLIIKCEANTHYGAGEFNKAMELYTKGLVLCRKQCDSERSVLHSNRAACHLANDEYNEVEEDCTSAILLNPHYIKALVRRAQTREKLDNLTGALEDYKSVLEHDSRNTGAISAVRRLPDQIKVQQEKMKEECLEKLKDLGNLVLKPFGLSTANFNMVQDPNSGGYNIQFNQNK